MTDIEYDEEYPDPAPTTLELQERIERLEEAVKWLKGAMHEHASYLLSQS